MSYRIQRDPNTSLWIVFYQGVNFRSLPDGNILSRAAEPQVAINLARQRVQQINDPVTGVGAGSLPPLTSEIEAELLVRAAQIEQQERQQLETSRNDQGNSTVSAGGTVTEAADARDDLAVTQSPATPAQEITDQGTVITSPAITQPSNSAPSQAPVPTQPPAPEKLPGSTDVARGNQSPSPATQLGGSNLSTPDENTNQVSYIYRAIQVTSNFRQGKFTQELQGAQIFFPITAQQQQSPNTGRVANQSAARDDRAGARPQDTVTKTATTAGVPIPTDVAPGLLELEGFGDGTIPATARAAVRTGTVTALPGSILEAQGLGDPTAEQVPVTAPLTSSPPTTGSAPGAADAVAVAPQRSQPAAQGAPEQVSLQDQLRLARNNKASFEKSLAQVEDRIARREGNPLANRDMRALYASNLAIENRIIAELEARLAEDQARFQRRPGSIVNISPQVGAKEY